jgi:hypothetical protein
LKSSDVQVSFNNDGLEAMGEGKNKNTEGRTEQVFIRVLLRGS